MGNEEFALRLTQMVGALREANLEAIDPIKVSRLRKSFDRLIDEIAATPDLDDDLRAQLAKVKRAAAFHQLLWGTCRMLKQPEAYRKDAKAVGMHVTALIERLEACPLSGHRRHEAAPRHLQH